MSQDNTEQFNQMLQLMQQLATDFEHIKNNNQQIEKSLIEIGIRLQKLEEQQLGAPQLNDAIEEIRAKVNSLADLLGSQAR